MAGIRTALAWIRAALARIRATLTGIGVSLAGIGAALARTHDIRAAGGKVEGQEQYQESTAHDLHEGPSFGWGINHSGELPSARLGA